MLSRHKIRVQGMTLIELVITLAIVAIVLTIGLPSYGQWIQNTQIRTAAESIQNGLQLARLEAVRRNTAVDFTFTGTNWAVAVVAPAETVQSKSGAEGSPNVAVAATVNPITFNGLGRVTSPGAGDIQINLTNAVGGNRPLRVVVTRGGEIRMCDPALSRATNPQGCS